MYVRVIPSSICLIVFIAPVVASSKDCSISGDCEKRRKENVTKCCNGTCMEICNSIKCQFDTDCPSEQSCCDIGECKAQVLFCSLSSRLAIIIPVSLL